MEECKNQLQLKLAHGYFPFQNLQDVNVSIKSFNCGTIFCELCMPYGTDCEYVYDE